MRLISPITTLCIRVEDICSRWLWCRYLSKDVAIRAKYPRNLQNWSELGRLDSEVVWTTKNTKIQNSCSELADGWTTAGLNQKVSRNTNSWELLSHKSCSPVSALKGSNNFLICELKPNTLFFVLTMFISHLSPESQIRYKLQDKRALEGETNSAAFLNECSQYRSGLWICQIAGSLFCELRSNTGLQLTISQLEYRAATQR